MKNGADQLRVSARARRSPDNTSEAKLQSEQHALTPGAGRVRPAAAPRLPGQPAVVATAVVLVGALLAWLHGNGRLGALLLVGVLLGVTLYHAAFGFGSAYRRLLLHRETDGVLAQLVMLAAATMLFAPVLAEGAFLGRAVVGAVAPVGWQVVAGALLFGVGMQLGGGCGSGTLYSAGGGNARMLVTLAAFVAGSFWASLHLPWWRTLPSVGALSVAGLLGWPLAVASQLGLLLVLALALRRCGRRRRPGPQAGPGWRRLLGGPWPLVAGALLLAVLNFATLAIAGHPWTITWAFTLWGAKAAAALGWDPATSAFWSGGFQQRALAGGVLDDTTSVMDLGIMLGALGAAGLAGRFAPTLRMPLRSLLAALLGGLAMGYGARVAFGCNIGAFFSGVASTSLHGWVWIAAALAGTWLGVRLRPAFGLGNGD